MPPALAVAVAALTVPRFTSAQVGQVIHLTSKFAANTPDLEWMEALGNERGTRWAIISKDGFRKQNGAERQVQRQHGLSVFVLQKSWSKQPYWAMSAQLVHWWPRIVEQALETERVALEVPWAISGRFKQI